MWYLFCSINEFLYLLSIVVVKVSVCVTIAGLSDTTSSKVKRKAYLF